MEIIENVGKKSGCLLIQLPPITTILYFNQLEKLLVAVQKANTGNKWKVVVEFRHVSWYQKKTYNLLMQQNATIVLHDMPASAISSLIIETNFIYVRFHGIKGDYKGSYTNEFLEEYAGYIKKWQQEGKTVYAYFNNTIGDAVKNLMVLNDYVCL